MRINPVSSNGTTRHASHSVGRRSAVSIDKPTTSWDSMRPFKKATYDPPKSLITQTNTTRLPAGLATAKANAMSHSTTDFFRRENGSMLPPQHGRNRDKKTLVLDLDETLVHSSFQPVQNEDFVLPIEIEGKLIKIYVMKRPGAEEFIEKMSEIYEVVIYTASMSKYANPLLDKIDPRRHASHRLFREHCTFLGTAFVKDLAQLGRNLKDVIIVDNSPASYAFQPANAVPIRTWIDDKSDTQLYELIPVLEILSKVHDVREHLRKIAKNDQINCAQALKILRTELEPQRTPSTEPRTALINSWVPQQGRITTTQGTEKTQQSQMVGKDPSRYTQPPQEQSVTARLASTYRPARDRVMYANAAARHEPGDKTPLSGKNLRRSVEIKAEHTSPSIDVKDQKVVSSSPGTDPAHRPGTFMVQHRSDRYAYMARGTPTASSSGAYSNGYSSGYTDGKPTGNVVAGVIVNGTNSNDTTGYGANKDNVTSYGPNKDTTMSYGSNKDNVTSYRPNKDTTMSYGPNKDNVTSYGANKDTTMSYGPNKDTTMSYGANKDTATSYGPNKDTVTIYGANKDTATSYGASNDVTAYGASKGVAAYGARKDGTVYGARNEVTPYGSRKDATSYGAIKDTTSYGASKDATSYGAKKDTTPYGARKDATSYGASKDATSYGVRKDASSYGASKEATPYGARKDATSYGARKDATSYEASKGTTTYGAGNGTTVARGKSCSTTSSVNRSTVIRSPSNESFTSTPSYIPGTPGSAHRPLPPRPSTSGPGSRTASTHVPSTPSSYNYTPTVRGSLGTPTAAATPMTSAGMRTTRNVSGEKVADPGRPSLYYSNLLRTKNDSEHRVDPEPSADKVSRQPAESRTHSSLTAKHGKNSYSLDREGRSNDADAVKKELRFDTESSEIEYEKRYGTSSTGFMMNSANLRKNAMLNNQTTVKSYMYNSNEYPARGTDVGTTAAAAKTASAGFYAWASDKRVAAVKDSASTTMRDSYSVAYLKERQSALSASRPNLISRTGGVYIPYSINRVGLVGYPNY